MASSQNEQPTGNSSEDCPTSVTEEEWYRPDTHSIQLRRLSAGRTTVTSQRRCGGREREKQRGGLESEFRLRHLLKGELDEGKEDETNGEQCRSNPDELG